MGELITVCFTSYNRFDLLSRSLESFLALNKTPIAKIIVIENSANLDMKNKILNRYGNHITLIFNDTHIGQVKSIDKMYDQVETDYILHAEDDFLFENNSNFIQDAADVLNENNNIHQIWLKHLDDFRSTHGQIFIDLSFENQILHTSTNVPFQMLKPVIMGNWHGFSFITHLKRKSDYKRMFPNGYQAHIKNNEANSLAESIIDLAAGEMNYRAATLVNTCGKDIGRGRNG